ncbi:MAG TPA: hypothetical protein GX731_07650 [Clostridiales bacterium]|nr:hypothetical protein [Clostridiales bacterium]
MEILLVIIGGFLLFIIIANAVKIAVKEALHEFKDEILMELKELKESNIIKHDVNTDND